MKARPLVGSVRVVRMPMVVDLPAPLGPSSPKISPARISSETPSSATSSNFFFSFVRPTHRREGEARARPRHRRRRVVHLAQIFDANSDSHLRAPPFRAARDPESRAPVRSRPVPPPACSPSPVCRPRPRARSISGPMALPQSSHASARSQMRFTASGSLASFLAAGSRQPEYPPAALHLGLDHALLLRAAGGSDRRSPRSRVYMPPERCSYLLHELVPVLRLFGEQREDAPAASPPARRIAACPSTERRRDPDWLLAHDISHDISIGIGLQALGRYTGRAWPNKRFLVVIL